MRRLPIGAEVSKEGVHFRVWAPKCQTVEVLIDGQKAYPLHSDANGYFSGEVKHAKTNTLYQFILDGKKPLPDPASRFQPEGPHGPSQVIDPTLFAWTDSAWEGITDPAKVILYEMHIGTFTQEGTWQAAIAKLPHLVELGINVIEMMPISEFPGQFNWGYDGVNLFAPTHNYGTPDDLRAFIDAAHHLGLGVILDVVYNHFGPDGNYLGQFSDFYFNEIENDWGTSLNFDADNSPPVREFFIENAGYWIEEFHFDGLRFDACQSIYDSTKPHILYEITHKVREKAGKKKTYVSAENERQQAHYALPKSQEGYGIDGIWNEDFHHAAFVKLTGHNEAYFNDYQGRAQEFISAVKYGFLYQGQWYAWQKQGRGSYAFHLKPHQFIVFLENHDQIANTGSALRLWKLSHPGAFRAMTALLLLSPQTPLLFQGQEWGSSSPFYYFCDHQDELIEKINEGRIKFLTQFTTMDDPEVTKEIPLPNRKQTFLDSKLQWKDKEDNTALYQLHKDLIEMRKKDPVFSRLSETKIDGAVLERDLFVIRYFSDHGERLLIVNFGIDAKVFPASEPLLGPPYNTSWKMKWCSEMPSYGGFGYLKIPHKGNWQITGCSAYLLGDS